MVDGPTAADESGAAGAMVGDAAMAVLYRAFLAVGVQVDAIALALRASSVRVWDAGRIVADARPVADVRRCLCLVWMLVWVPA